MRTHRLIALIAFILLLFSTAATSAAVLSQPARASSRARTPLRLVSDKERSHAAAPTAAPAAPPAPGLSPAAADYIQMTSFFAMLTYFQGLAEEQAASQPAPTHHVSYSSRSSTPSSGGGGGANWAAIRQCESGGNYSANTGNGYYGAYQFSASTWHSLGYSGLPSNAPASVQDQAAAQLAARSGMGQWPVCGRRG